MPAKKQTGPQAEGEYARAGWDWAIEVRDESEVLTQVSLYPAGQVGVWHVTVRHLMHVDGRPAAILASETGQWPNSQNVSFFGYVWALQMRLKERVERDAEGLVRPQV